MYYTPTSKNKTTPLVKLVRVAILFEFLVGWGRIRTFEGIKPADLQSAAVDHFATHPDLCTSFNGAVVRG